MESEIVMARIATDRRELAEGKSAPAEKGVGGKNGGEENGQIKKPPLRMALSILE
jgi:hypothetical protein